MRALSARPTRAARTERGLGAGVAFARRSVAAGAAASSCRARAPLRAFRAPFVLSQDGGFGRSDEAMRRLYQNVCANAMAAASEFRARCGGRLACDRRWRRGPAARWPPSPARCA